MTTIPVTPDIKALNEAVENFDWVTRYKYEAVTDLETIASLIFGKLLNEREMPLEEYKELARSYSKIRSHCPI